MNAIVYKISKYNYKLNNNTYKKAIYLTKIKYYTNKLNQLGGQNENLDIQEYTVPDNLSFIYLDINDSFTQCSKKEQLYIYYMYKASNSFRPIVSKQVSPESNMLVTFFINLLKNTDLNTINYNKDIEQFFNYIALLFANCGNYLSYGDKKFIPNIDKSVFTLILEKINNYSHNHDYKQIIDIIYSLTENNKILGLPPKTTTYYSDNMNIDDINIVDKFMKTVNLDAENTRIDLTNNTYTIHVASIQDYKIEHSYDNKQIIIKYGDYKEELTNVVKYLKLALNYTANTTQYNMLNHYIDHFTTGNINSHRKAQLEWIKDKNPSIEVNMGFIENYRDPLSTRAAAQSFVSIVNKKISSKFQKLVDIAPDLLKLLPWSKHTKCVEHTKHTKCVDNKNIQIYEKDVFLKPDFTSLEVVSFVGSSIPLGINIPNYDDIRQNIGFKNISLHNIITNSFITNSDKQIDYLSVSDSELYKKYIITAYEIQVAGHELLGHGSGKLFYQYKNKLYNFDRELLPDITFYKESDKETFSSVFGPISNAYEECRSECVGLFFSTNYDVYKIISNNNSHNNSHNEFENTYYINWLHMVRSGIVSLSSYNVENKKWTQAHSNARFVILNVLLNSTDNFIKITNIKNNIIIQIDKTKILTEGMESLSKFMTKLQIYKSTANKKDGTELFNKLSEVSNYFLELRKIVMQIPKTKPVYIEPTLILLNDQDVVIKDYKETTNLIAITAVTAVKAFIDKNI